MLYLDSRIVMGLAELGELVVGQIVLCGTFSDVSCGLRESDYCFVSGGEKRETRTEN